MPRRADLVATFTALDDLFRSDYPMSDGTTVNVWGALDALAIYLRPNR